MLASFPNPIALNSTFSPGLHPPPRNSPPPVQSSCPAQTTMASSSSSRIGVSSVYQAARVTADSKGFKFNPRLFFDLWRARQQQPVSSLITSAVAMPDSILSEEAFKGLRGFSKANFDDEDDEVEYESEDDVAEAAGDDELAITKPGLPQRLVETLELRGITHLFPIPRAVLVPAPEGRDIIARAKTGTGKTFAFGIPIIKRLTEDDLERSSSRRAGRLPRVLVLAPTRELAKQVEKEIKESAPYLSTVCVYGGVSYALQRGVDVAVGTPGRIIDLINSNSLNLGEVEFLVLDEADQMLAVGFEEDLELILEKLPSQRQSMLFSDTMPIWVKKLARKYLDNPLTIDLVMDRIHMMADERISGCVSDLPEEIAKELLSKQLPPGNTVTRVAKLPASQDSGPPSDNYGRFDRERAEAHQAEAGGAVVEMMICDDWSQNARSRSSDDWSRNPRTSSDDCSLSSRTGSPRTSSDNWLVGGGSSFRPSGGGSRSGFGGACFTCGRSGHRSSECPNKKGL